MGDAITPFNFNGAVVRVLVDEYGEAWFVASDVASVLGYGDATHATRGLDEDEKGLRIVETPGGSQRVVIVTEAGLYALILRSRVERAKPFRRWVTHEVLPSIRKTGSFGVSAFDPADPRVVLAVIEAQRSQVLALETTVENQRAELADAAPKVEVYDRIVDCGDTVGFREAAKLIRAATGANENEVRGLMRSRGWIQRLDGKLARAPRASNHPEGCRARDRGSAFDRGGLASWPKIASTLSRASAVQPSP